MLNVGAGVRKKETDNGSMVASNSFMKRCGTRLQNEGGQLKNGERNGNMY